MDNSIKMILATYDGKEVKFIQDGTIDVECGEENTFIVEFPRMVWTGEIAEGSRLFIPGTEYGGIVRTLATDTDNDTVTVGGITWRGMMDKKIIRPPAGADYATASGDLNEIIKGYVEKEFPGLFYGVTETTVTLNNYQFERYCTMLSGFTKMCKSAGYRINVQYVEGNNGVAGHVEVKAVPIIDYSKTIELSEDNRLNYKASQNHAGTNHLVCLGAGELKDRIVVDLYVNQNGEISQRQTFFGSDEIAEVYDSNGSARSELITGGKERLNEVKNNTSFEMNVANLDMGGIEIGDIIGGRDYLTGISMQKPITGKIYKFDGLNEEVEYKISEQE